MGGVGTRHQQQRSDDDCPEELRLDALVQPRWPLPRHQLPHRPPDALRVQSARLDTARTQEETRGEDLDRPFRRAEKPPRQRSAPALAWLRRGGMGELNDSAGRAGSTKLLAPAA